MTTTTVSSTSTHYYLYDTTHRAYLLRYDSQGNIECDRTLEGFQGYGFHFLSAQEARDFLGELVQAGYTDLVPPRIHIVQRTVVITTTYTAVAADAGR